MTKQKFHGTMILDTSFIMNMEKFDQFCRGKQFNPPKTPEQLPLLLLDRFAREGCQLLIPNAVLKELALKDNARIGISVDNQGYASFDAAAIRQSAFGSTHFGQYLLQLHTDGRLQCFGSVEDFNTAQRAGDMRGCVSIVADNGNTRLAGRESITFKRDPNDAVWRKGRPVFNPSAAKGDQEILSIAGQLPIKPQRFVLLGDTNLKKRLWDKENVNTIFPNEYLTLLGLVSLVPNANTFPMLGSQFPHDNNLFKKTRPDYEHPARTAHMLTTPPPGKPAGEISEKTFHGRFTGAEAQRSQTSQDNGWQKD